MNEGDPAFATTMKFGVGQPVARTEDPRLLRGEGRFTDDFDLPRQAVGCSVRSPVAHGVLENVDISAALAAPGVLAVYTGADMEAAGYGHFPCVLTLKSHDGRPLIAPPRPAMALDRVRHVGDLVAFVVAETLEAARDAAELVMLEIEPLPAITAAEDAVAEGAPVIWDEAPDNVCLDWRGGDIEATDQAFAEAAHVTRLRLVSNRVVAAPIEPRVALAEYDAESERFTLRASCQGVFGLRQTLANVLLKVPPEQVRVLADDVGGSFGIKIPPYPEYVPMLHGARALGRPIKWCDERGGSFLTDQQGRDEVVDGELALDADGTFLAVRISGLGNLGAYVSPVGPLPLSANILKNLPGVYRTPAADVHIRCVFTNTTLTGPYRGAGRPEANYYMERLIDQAARETGRDPVELRRGNLIPAAAMPFTAASGMEYDSGDFATILDLCVDNADWAGFPARREAARAAGRLRGLGLACYLEVTAPPAGEMGGLRFEDDGTVTIVTGTFNYGQGHATAFAQVLVDKLGIPFERIRLHQGDSDELIAGGGSGGSRSIMASGTAILTAGDQVIEKGRELAGHFLEAAAADVEFGEGEFRIVGTDRAIGILELAERVRGAGALPGELPDSLDVELVADAVPSTFPNGCHICEVEVDPATGAVAVDRYTVVDDFGTLVNPLLVEGQVHGGVVQGIGQALLEETAYDEGGQLLSGSFMDYAMPRADHIPDMAFATHAVPATTNPLGVKGCGEAGCTGALPAVMNALADALAQAGAGPIDMPATPERVWRALREASASAD
jgi:carbon-monoxide dehydrogenase large subunit